MGLFDHVRCDYPLPDGKPGGSFQTKSFDAPYLEQYRITAEGRLLYDRARYAADPPNKLVDWIDTNFHGVLNFYDYVDETKEWREFNAIFTHGQLEMIQDMSEGGG